MKLKKFFATVCSLAVIASTVSFSTVMAADEDYKIGLEFAGYSTAGTTTFAMVDVVMEIPEDLSAYTEIEPDWENTFDYEYSGLAIQGMGIDIPYVEGLQFIPAKSSKKMDCITISDNKNDQKAILSYAATGAFDTYYAGETNMTIATLAYRITGDVNGSYDLAISSAKVGFATWSGTSSTPSVYEKQLNRTGCTVEPEKEDEPSYPSNETYVTEELTVAGVTNPYVSITLGEKTNDYYLPAGVKGDAKVYGLLKYIADGTNIKHGDVFKLNLMSKDCAEGSLVKALADHTVNAAD